MVTKLLMGCALAVALPLAAVAGVSAAGDEDSPGYEATTYETTAGDVTVYVSATDPPVYSLEPIMHDAAETLPGLAATHGASATTGDLEDCQQAEQADRIDPACAVMLEAAANDDLDVVPGDRTMLRTVPCKQQAAPGQLAVCDEFVTEDEAEAALQTGGE